MNDRIVVDTSSIRELAAACGRARRVVADEGDALRHACRDTAAAMGRGEIRAQYPAVHRQSLRVLANLAESLDRFARYRRRPRRRRRTDRRRPRAPGRALPDAEGRRRERRPVSDEDGGHGFLDYIARPPGDGPAAGRAWGRAADGIGESLRRLDREMASVVGTRWSGRDARLVLDRWHDLHRAGRDAERHFRDVGRELASLGRAIEDAQHQWDTAMAAAAVTVGVSIGLTFLTFGLSNAAAAAAAARTAALTATIAAWLDGIVQGAGLMFMALVETGTALGARLLVGFSVNVAAQSVSGAVTSPDHSPLHIEADEALLFAGVDLFAGSSARALLPSKAPVWAIEAGTSMGSDALAQLAASEHVDPLEVLLSGGMGAGSAKVVEGLAGRLGDLGEAFRSRSPGNTIPPDPDAQWQVPGSPSFRRELDELPGGQIPSGSAGTTIPRGFAGPTEFGEFGGRLSGWLAGAGFGHTQAAVQGSAVTGHNFRTGAAFDVGRVSDLDIALAGEDIFRAAEEVGVRLRADGTRTGPLRPNELELLGLTELRSNARKLAGRPVNFMIYRSVADALARRPSILVP